LADLLSVQEAQARILSAFQPVETETVQLELCAGRILGEDLRAPGDLPPFDNSSMDGFAVIAADVENASAENPVILAITSDIPAGSTTTGEIRPGQAARIMTGAPLPRGADAVIPVEDSNFAPGLSPEPPPVVIPGPVTIFKSMQIGENIRPRGQDVQAGQELLRTGRRIHPQDAGLLASTGKANICLYRKPRIALFSSGDELVQPGQEILPGQIFDSNQYVLAAMLEREGTEVIRLGTAPDDPDAIQSLLQQAVVQKADLIVTSAGVSVGAFDYIRQVIEANGKLGFWKVNMRPGKPLAFGSFDGIPLIGLPGNPVSAFVGCLVFVLPAVYKLSGREQRLPYRAKAVLSEPVESDGRESYLRAVVRSEGGQLTASLTGHQGSGNLFSLVQANALLIVPSGVKSLPSGAQAEVWFLEDH
jgi:molybdopterin molybdotransferase